MKRYVSIATIVIVLAGIGWFTASGYAAGLYRYAQAGFPSAQAIEDCPMSHTYYGFEGDVLVTVTCVGG
ncbi:hypothetical protein MCELHM10_02957 [Paracoccaceae bacterium]|jgi:hypothetical protein